MSLGVLENEIHNASWVVVGGFERMDVWICAVAKMQKSVASGEDTQDAVTVSHALPHCQPVCS